MSRARPVMLFYVQHLLGIGHLRRAATLARAIQAAGIDMVFVSGGPAVPGLDTGAARFVQLPPVFAADRTFEALVDGAGDPVTEALKDERRKMLLAAWRAATPDILMTELFPFGRRQLRFELIPLLDEAAAARPRPLIVSSVRDILVEASRPERMEQRLALVDQYYDQVLVHSDPALIPFDETFPLAHRIADRMHYTGYVVEEPPPAGASDAGTGEVIVSAGGGALSEPLLRAAMAARPLTRLKDATWRLLAGPALPEPVFASIRDAAPSGVIVERARPDFLTLLANCTLSISQGGYNTVMEILQAGTRAVVCPYAGGRETEQTLRARLLARRRPLQIVNEGDIAPRSIATAAEAALDGPRPDASGLDTRGAEKSARLIAGFLAAAVP